LLAASSKASSRGGRNQLALLTFFDSHFHTISQEKLKLRHTFGLIFDLFHDKRKANAAVAKTGGTQPRRQTGKRQHARRTSECRRPKASIQRRMLRMDGLRARATEMERGGLFKRKQLRTGRKKEEGQQEWSALVFASGLPFACTVACASLFGVSIHRKISDA
jgi:hypothetical protein